MKNQYRGRDCLKREAWTVCRFKGGGWGLGKKEGVVFFRGGGVDNPMHTMVYNESLYCCNSFMLEQISYLGKF